MKHLQLFENSGQFTINDINKYNSLMQDIRIYVAKELANDNQTEKYDYFIIERIRVTGSSLEIKVLTYLNDFEGRKEKGVHWFNVSDFGEMLDEINAIKDADKYNL